MRNSALRPALVWLVFAFCWLPVSAQAQAGRSAVEATIVGEKIQKVGFRALVQTLAIQYNLAGSVRNEADGTVRVRLEGASDRIDRVLAKLQRGRKKSSRDNRVNQSPVAMSPQLDTFTIYGWTSVSRNITTPYDLVFQLRPDDRVIKRKAAKQVWNAIALATLKGEDRVKFEKRL